MNKMCSMTIMVAMVALLILSMTVQASPMGSRIELSFKTYPAGDDIKIESVNGVGTLTGMVSEESQKLLVPESVAALLGCRSVDNRIEIKGKRPVENSDAWLAVKVKTTLLLHRSVNAGATEIDVTDGIVTLRGAAASQPQKDLTAECAKDVDGIRDVKNEMVVASPSKSANHRRKN